MPVLSTEHTSLARLGEQLIGGTYYIFFIKWMRFAVRHAYALPGALLLPPCGCGHLYFSELSFLSVKRANSS